MMVRPPCSIAQNFMTAWSINQIMILISTNRLFKELLGFIFSDLCQLHTFRNQCGCGKDSPQGLERNLKTSKIYIEALEEKYYH